jgi:ribosomal biogenesis protein LAS1
MAWKLRGNLPHAVESTALLVEAILHHDIKSNSSFSIRAVYSAAFTRFVTGFCDIGRHKERALEPSSMLDIAKQIGMPVEFVALRHEATHEELPGIQRLVSATQQALEWLWKVYWSRLEEPEDEEAVSASLAEMKAEAASVLREFRRARRDALKSQRQSPAEESGEVMATGAKCVDMCRGSPARTEAVASVTVEERLLLPSSRE